MIQQLLNVMEPSGSAVALGVLGNLTYDLIKPHLAVLVERRGWRMSDADRKAHVAVCATVIKLTQEVPFRVITDFLKSESVRCTLVRGLGTDPVDVPSLVQELREAIGRDVGVKLGLDAAGLTLESFVDRFVDGFERAVLEQAGPEFMLLAKMLKSVEDKVDGLKNHGSSVHRGEDVPGVMYPSLTEGLWGLPGAPFSRVERFLYEYIGDDEHPVTFGGRASDLLALDEWLESPNQPYAVLGAEAGRGKSALLARWALTTSRQRGIRVCYVPLSIRFGTASKSVAMGILIGRLHHILEVHSAEESDDPVGLFERYLSSPKLRKERPLVIVFDGADETLGWTFTEELRFPMRIADGIKVLISARGVAEDWSTRLGLRSVRHFKLDLLGRTAIRDVLRTNLPPHIEASQSEPFVEELERLTSGEPLLIRLYTDELAKRAQLGSQLTIGELKLFKPGFDEFMERWWQEQKRMWEHVHPSPLQRVSSLIGMLSCAMGPLLLSDINAITSDLGTWVEVEQCMQHLSRFIVGDGLEQGYVFSHPRLRQYFFDHLTRVAPGQLSKWQDRFLSYCGKVVSSLMDGVTRPSEISRYVLRHYGEHLDETPCRITELYSLVNDRWLQAWEAADGSASGYVVDAERAWARAREERYVGMQARAVLTVVSVATFGNNLPPKLLRRLIVEGRITPPRALSMIRQAFDEHHRAELCGAVVPILDQPSRLLSYDIALGIRDPLCRAYSIAAVADYLPDSDRALAWEITLKSLESGLGSGNHWYQRWVVEICAKAPAAITIRLMELVDRLHDPERQIQLIQAVAPYVSKEMMEPKVSNVSISIKSISNRLRRLDHLLELLPYLPDELRPGAISETKTLLKTVDKQHGYMHPVLAHLCKLLNPKDADKIIRDFVLKSNDFPALGRDLEALAPFMSAGLREACAQTWMVTREPYDALEGLSALAPWLSDQCVEDILRKTKELPDSRRRLYIYAGLAAHSHQGEDLARYVLEESSSLEPPLNVLVVFKVLGRLPLDLRTKVAADFTQVALAYPRYHGIIVGIVQGSSFLNESQWAVLLTGLRDLHDDERVALLGELAETIPDSLLPMSLDIAMAVQDTLPRIQIMAGLARYCPEPLRLLLKEKAFKLVLSLRGLTAKASAYSSLASAFAEDLEGLDLQRKALECFEPVRERPLNFNVACQILDKFPTLNPSESYITWVIQQILSERRTGWSLGYLPRKAKRLVERLHGPAKMEMIKRWLAYADSLGEGSAKAVELAFVSSELPEPDRSRVYWSALGNDVGPTVLFEIAELIPEDLAIPVVQLLTRIEDPNMRARCLLPFARHLPEELHSTVSILWEDATVPVKTRATALCVMAPYCKSEGHGNIVEKALGAIRELSAFEGRADLLIRLVRYLPEPWKHAKMEDLLEATVEILPHGTFFEAALELVPDLAKWARLHPKNGHVAWETVAASLRRLPRPEALSVLSCFVPLIQALAGSEGVGEVARAVLDLRGLGDEM